MSDDLKQKLIERLRKVPDRVNRGSAQTVREFLSFQKKTVTELSRKTLSESRLIQLRTAVSNWYDG